MELRDKILHLTQEFKMGIDTEFNECLARHIEDHLHMKYSSKWKDYYEHEIARYKVQSIKQENMIALLKEILD